MSDTVIQVDDVSKSYRLGTIGGKRLVDDVNRSWARLRGKEDPLSKVSGNAGTAAKSNSQSEILTDHLWALKDVSFDVKQGDVLGVIGRNGAGKSTLLKILSRVTAPTSGEVRVKGRIASLLEVGTGFHPELTGRENIFLNGAILGMTKFEIRKKFDEILDFSGVEKFIDTPVKRYSSGMYVRLAFAVAAHLEPEILVVDEVLAVGDAGFQKKCLGKMGEVAGGGRSILFVSHNLAAVRSLCHRCVLLEDGRITEEGDPGRVIDRYSESCHEKVSMSASVISGDPHCGEDVSLSFEKMSRRIRIPCGSPLKFEFMVRSPRQLRDLDIGVTLMSVEGAPVMAMSSKVQAITTNRGYANMWRVEANLGVVPLNAGNYLGRVYIGSAGLDVARFTDAIVIEVLEHDVFGWGNSIPPASAWGPTYWAPNWNIKPAHPDADVA